MSGAWGEEEGGEGGEEWISADSIEKKTRSTPQAACRTEVTNWEENKQLAMWTEGQAEMGKITI